MSFSPQEDRPASSPSALLRLFGGRWLRGSDPSGKAQGTVGGASRAQSPQPHSWPGALSARPAAVPRPLPHRPLRGPPPGAGRPRCPGGSRAPPGPAPAPEVSGEQQSPVMTTPSFGAAAAVAASFSAAPASLASGGIRSAIRGAFTCPLFCRGRAANLLAVSVVGASVRSPRGSPAGWRLSTGSPAPLHRQRAEVASVGKLTLTSGSQALGPFTVPAAARRIPGDPPGTGEDVGSPGPRPLDRVSQPGAEPLSRPLPGAPGTGEGVVQSGGRPSGISVPRNPALHPDRGRALAADPTARVPRTFSLTADRPHLRISGSQAFSHPLPGTDRETSSTSWGEPFSSSFGSQVHLTFHLSTAFFKVSQALSRSTSSSHPPCSL